MVVLGATTCYIELVLTSITVVAAVVRILSTYTTRVVPSNYISPITTKA